MEKMQPIWGFLKTNIDTIVTIIIAILVLIINLFDIFNVEDSSIITSAILLVLIMVSISILINRQENIKTRKSLLELSNLISDANITLKPTIKKEFDLNRTINLIVDSDQTLIFGSGHTVLLPLLYDKYTNGKLNSTKEIKILLMSPYGEAVKLAEFRAGRPLKILYQENLNMVKKLVSQDPQKFSFSMIDFLPPYNIIAINPEKSSGILFVRLSGWETGATDRPIICLKKKENPNIFNYFIDQFNIMWKRAVL